MWVGGVKPQEHIIVAGQDFVREGQRVEDGRAEAPKTTALSREAREPANRTQQGSYGNT
jgi:hypothetical protein